MSRPTTQDFFFIHRHDSSQGLSRGGHKERFQILSHVRRHTVIRKPWMQYSTVLDVTEAAFRQEHKPAREQQATLHSLLSESAICNDHNAHVQMSVPWLHTVNHNESVYAFLSTMWPSFNSLDPFHCKARSSSVTDRLHVVENLVGNRVPRTGFHTESLGAPSIFETRRSKTHDQARLERLEACAGDEISLCSSIAHTSSSLAWKSGQINDSRSQYWVGQTLKALRLQLAKPHTSNVDDVVLSMFTLALVALWNGLPHMWSDNSSEIDASQFNICQTHLRAMLVLVEQAGGWQRFSPYILEGMLLVDKYTALYTLSPPLIPLTFDLSTDQVDFFCSRVPAQSAIPEMATGFRELDIDLELKGILRDVGTFYHSAAGIWQVKVELTSQQENLIYRRFQALHYRLLLLQTTNTTSELVRRTTLVILCNTTLYAAGLVFTRVMLRHLYAAMRAVDPSTDEIDSRVWRWCLCTGATTRLAASEKSWFMDQFFEYSVKMDLGSISSEVPQLMTKYLYVPWLQNIELRALTERQRGKETRRVDTERLQQK